MNRIATTMLGGAVAFMATVTMAAAQDYSDYSEEEIAYSYDYYADAAKTEYQGTVSDRGCRQSGPYVYVQRANVPSAYFDKTPIFVCTRGGPYLPG